MRDLEAKTERSSVVQPSGLDGRTITPIVEPQYPVESQNNPMNQPPVPLEIGAPQNNDKLLDAEAVRQLRNENTKRNLKSNYWYEIASISRWATTGLIGATMITAFNVAVDMAAGGGTMSFAQFAGLGTQALGFVAQAMVNPLVLGLFAAVAVAAVVTVVTSQHSRKMFVEKTFDVQDFQMQRQAALIGKSVEHAVDDPSRAGQQPKWADRVSKSAEFSSHAARVQKAPETNNWAEKVAAKDSQPLVQAI